MGILLIVINVDPNVAASCKMCARCKGCDDCWRSGNVWFEVLVGKRQKCCDELE